MPYNIPGTIAIIVLVIIILVVIVSCINVVQQSKAYVCLLYTSLLRVKQAL